MKPDSDGPRPLVDHVEPAHLREVGDRSHQLWRFEPSSSLADLVTRFWIPVWSVPPGEEAVQRVLQHPGALVVIDGDGGRFSGVTSNLSTVALNGSGWSVGILFRPAGGFLVAGEMSAWTDRVEPFGVVFGSRGTEACGRVAEIMGPDPVAVANHEAAIGVLEGLLAPYADVDDEGRAINELVAMVEDDPSIQRVSDLSERLSMSERSLQRLTHHRLGLTPGWVIRRRRLHEATDALRRGDETIAEVASRLGYADQAHLTRDLRAVTDLTPRQIATQFAPTDEAVLE